MMDFLKVLFSLKVMIVVTSVILLSEEGCFTSIIVHVECSDSDYSVILLRISIKCMCHSVLVRHCSSMILEFKVSKNH